MSKRSIAREAMLDLVERRGFQGNNATVTLLLIDADVAPAAKSIQKLTKAKTLKPNVYGKRVKATRQSFMVYRLTDHGWTLVQRISGELPEAALAQQLSKDLKTRVMWLGLSDTASWTGYYLFDATGTMVELLEDFCDHHGDASHLDANLLGKLKVESTGNGIFGSTLRKVAVTKLQSGIEVHKLIDAFFRDENILAPFTGDWRTSPGSSVTLEIADLAPEDVERLDFVTA